MLTTVRHIFGRIMHSETALHSQWDKGRKNNLLFASLNSPFSAYSSMSWYSSSLNLTVTIWLIGLSTLGLPIFAICMPPSNPTLIILLVLPKINTSHETLRPLFPLFAIQFMRLC